MSKHIRYFTLYNTRLMEEQFQIEYYKKALSQKWIYFLYSRHCVHCVETTERRNLVFKFGYAKFHSDVDERVSLDTHSINLNVPSLLVPSIIIVIESLSTTVVHCSRKI